MSLTLPTSYESASKNSNIKENWAFQLFNSDSYLEFDGVDDYIDLGTTTASSSICVKGTSESGGTGISVSFLINFPELGQRESIFVPNTTATYSGYWIDKDENNKINFQWGDDTGAGQNDRRTMIGSTALSANTWYHVLITSTFANATSGTNIYINNVAETISDDGGSSVTTPTYVSDGKAYIGREDFTATNYGGELYIKNLAIWGAILDSNNRTAIYNSGNYKSLLYDFENYDQSSNLKGYWEFNNGEPTIKDLSGNLQNGTINGAVYKGFLPLATSNLSIDDIFYHGVVTETGSIRDSITLANSSAKTSNMSISIVNFNYKGNDISAELFLGSNDYLNYNIKVYSQLNDNSSLSSCFQIYQGRIINFLHDERQISIEFTEQRPWDFISIPSEKTTNSNIYIPIAYGNYEESDSSQDSQDLSETRALYPVPVDNTSGKITAVVAREYDGSSTEQKGRLHHFEKDCDQFVPVGLTSSSFTDTSESYQQNANAMKCRTDLFRGFKTKPKTVLSNEGSDYANPENAFDSRSDNFTTKTNISNNNSTVQRDIEYTPPNIVGKITNIKIFTRYKMTATDTGGIDGNLTLMVGSTSLKVITSTHNSGIRTDTYEVTGSDTSGQFKTLYTDNNNQLPNIKYRFAFTFDEGLTGETFTAEIYDVQIFVKVALGTDDESKESSKQYLDDLEYMYVGGSGLTESYSGSNGEIEHGHEVLRDMLVRYTGMDTAEPDGFSNLHTDRNTNNWKIRWWALEPVELKPVLEKLMYEFGFIFKFRADGTGRIIYIKQSSELSSNQELNQRDIKNIKISTSPFTDMITKMNINYEKHPAENKYLSSVTSSNDINRSKYKINLKENIKEIKLDMNVGTPNSTANSDCNFDFYSYYNNIIGDIKKIISCEIINKSKAYSLETGDIVTFSSSTGDMPVNPFGDNWDETGSKYYMITSLTRKINSVRIECREVG